MEWRPNKGRQEEFLEAIANGEYYEVGYGGSRGGGKTEGGIVSLLYEKDHPLYRALVVRRNAEDLKDWSDRADRIYSSQGFTRKGSPPEFEHIKGSKIRTGHLKDDHAYTKYQGHEYHRQLIEELTQIATEENYLKLAASCRSTIPELKPCIISTFNPDGPGFGWVKKRFNLHGIPLEPVITVDKITGLKRIFIPAKLEDNPKLSQDESYRAFLDGLPDGLREAWRDGSWDEPVITGGYYTLELNQARQDGRIRTSVPFDPSLRVHTVWDLGIGDSMAILFWQRIKGEMRLINCYSNEGHGLNHYIAKLQEFQTQNNYVYGSHFAPHDVNKRELTSGQTIIQTAKKMGIKFVPVPGIGIQDGIIKTRLMWPRISINEKRCEQAINAFRNYRKEWNEKLLKFSDDAVHDWASHYSDALRYSALVEDQMLNVSEEAEIEAAWNYKQPAHQAPGLDERFGSKPQTAFESRFGGRSVNPDQPLPPVTG